MFFLSRIISDLESTSSDVALMDTFFVALHYELFVKYYSVSTHKQMKSRLVANLFVNLLTALLVCSIAGWKLALLFTSYMKCLQV